MTYNPFNKPINDLTAQDLEILIQKEVAEGYSVEYKREFQPNQKTAKSISSFANTYGGWYFVGIESNKNKNTASRINGISLKDVQDPADKLREIIKSSIDPTPIFYHKIVQLDDLDKVVLVVEIPDNQETPFITSDGRIYRRVGDSSDPVSETNRYAVDRLVDNGKDISREFEEFCQDNRTFSKSEENQGWVNIYVSPYPLGIVNKIEMLSEEGMERLISLSQTSLKYYLYGQEIGYGNFPFNSGKLGIGSVILRQVEPAKVGFNSPSVELFIDGRAKFHIPLSYLPYTQVENTEEIKSLESKKALINIMERDAELDLTVLRFFDIERLWSIVGNQVNFYQNWFGKELESEEIKTAVVLDNIWRSVPFHDSDVWGSFVKKFGLPVQNTDFLRVPTKEGRGIMIDPANWHTICSVIGLAFGLPPSMYSDIMFGTQQES
jgi:hypothetical protein